MKVPPEIPTNSNAIEGIINAPVFFSKSLMLNKISELIVSIIGVFEKKLT